MVTGEMFQSSLANPIRTDLSFVTDHGQLNMDSICDWSKCCGTWQKSLKRDECPLRRCKESVSTGEGELSRTCSNLSAVDDMCASSVPKRDGYVYKRRKLHMNTVALLPEENALESTKTSSVNHSLTALSVDLDIAPSTNIGFNNTTGNGNPPISSSHIRDSRNLEPIENVLPCVGKDKVPAESSLIIICGMNGSCSSSRSDVGHNSTSMKVEVEEVGECSSSETLAAEPLGKFNSVKELCISVLESHGLLGGAWTTDACVSLDAMAVADSNCAQPCKVCGCLDNLLEMLICDLCEGAFHMSCCNPRIKTPPEVDEWYCQFCLKRNPKCVRRNCTGKLLENDGEISERYMSKVRIGIGFQAEVPQWSGPISDDCNYFDEPMELDPAHCASLNSWKFNKPPTIGNWLQCRDVIYKDGDNNEGTICGKWRRAPLSEVQTEDWDCSCAVLWDAIHADCAVPQELDTDIVFKHLKYVEKWRFLFSNKQKTDQTRRVGSD